MAEHGSVIQPDSLPSMSDADDSASGSIENDSAPSGEGAADAREREQRQAMLRRQALAFGDLTSLALQHPVYRNYAIADLDWLIGPAVLTGNFMMANAARPDGVVVPVAAIIWARVSKEVDQRIMENLHRPFRLSPEEYVSGEIYWLAHTFGLPQVVEELIKAALREEGVDEHGNKVPAGPLAGKQLKQRTRDDSGRPVVGVMG